MPLLERRKRLFWVLGIGSVILGLGIVIMSFLGASRELVLVDDRMDELRKVRVGTYRFPETGILPDNNLYSLKEYRDRWWLETTRGTEDKAKLAVFQADKKWLEAIRLKQENKTDLALRTGKESLDRLQYANQQKEKINDEWKRGEIGKMIEAALAAYRELAKTEQLQDLNQFLDNWNETQAKKNY